jgi:carbonic anhydrase
MVDGASEQLGYQREQLTPVSLLKDNRSPSAKKNIFEWREAKEAKNGQLTMVVLCSDARLNSVLLFNNRKIASVSSIAANGETEPFKYLLNHGAIGKTVVIGHYDGEKAKTKNVVEGCGGIGERARLAETERVASDDLGDYVSRIESPDVLQQTLIIVEKIARLTDKPIFGTAVDHLSYEIHPLAQAVTDEKGVRHIIYNSELQKPASQRKQTIPLIPEGEIDPMFKQLLDENQRVAQRLNLDSSFSESQKIQNPKAVVLSTSPLPLALRYPETFGQPNTGFVVRLPFSKSEPEKITITKKFLREVTAQIKYPISHAIIATEKGEAFSDTKTLIIETPSLELSAEIAQRLIEEQEFIRNWIEIKGGKIIIAEIEAGAKATSKMQYFSPENSS